MIFMVWLFVFIVMISLSTNVIWDERAKDCGHDSCNVTNNDYQLIGDFSNETQITTVYYFPGHDIVQPIFFGFFP